jgi:hypothetical protein
VTCARGFVATPGIDLTVWNTVFLDRLLAIKLTKNLSAFYVTEILILVFT